MYLRSIPFVLTVLIATLVCRANNAPTVTSVTASQRTDGSGIVVITYTLTDADNDKCTITVQVSNDGGNTWAVPAKTFLSGSAVGPGISPGRRQILWDSRKDLPGVFGTNYQIKVMADDGSPDIGLMAYYRLDDTSGPVRDELGNHNGIAYGVTRGVQGVVGRAFLFDGVDDSVQVAEGLTGSSSEASFAYWVKIVRWQRHGYILTNSNVNVPRPISSALGWDSGDTRVSVWFGDATAVVKSATALQLGEWYHIAATYDGLTARLYVNGRLESSASFQKVLIWQGPFWLGRRAEYDSTYPFNGVIDEVKVWSRSLSASEVQFLSHYTPVEGG